MFLPDLHDLGILIEGLIHDYDLLTLNVSE